MNSAIFTRAEDRVLTASYDKTVRIWDARNGEELFTVRHAHRINFVVFNKSEDMVLFSALDGVTAWDISSNTRLFTYGRLAQSAVFNDAEDRVIVMCKAGNVWIWDVKSGVKVQTLSPQGIVLSISINRFMG